MILKFVTAFYRYQSMPSWCGGVYKTCPLLQKLPPGRDGKWVMTEQIICVFIFFKLQQWMCKIVTHHGT